MKRKTPTDLRRAQTAKTVRTLVRLRHSLAADEELNSLLPDTLEEFDAALARGELKSAAEAIRDVLEA